MATLNGWQRLWVVLGVLWALVVFVFGWGDWPQHAQRTAGESHEYPYDFSQKGPSYVRSDLIVIRETDGTEHIFARGTDSKAAADQVRQARRTLRVQFLFATFVVWLVPLLFLYALGWSVGWIRRGFRSA